MDTCDYALLQQIRRLALDLSNPGMRRLVEKAIDAILICQALGMWK